MKIRTRFHFLFFCFTAVLAVVPAPPAVAQLDEAKIFVDAGNVINWEPVDGATSYDVLSSPVPRFSAGLIYLGIGIPGTTLTDGLPLGSRELRHYLVRPNDDVQGQLGSWGFDSNGVERLNLDSDEDGAPDLVDNCLQARNPLQVDMDNDGVGDICDNCPTAFNPDQDDANGDGGGDACEPSFEITRCGTPFLPSPGIAQELFDAGFPHPMMPGVVHPVIQFSTALMDIHHPQLAAIPSLRFGEALEHNVRLASVKQGDLDQLGSLNFVRSIFPLPNECRENEEPACPHLEYGRWNVGQVDPSPPGLRKHAMAWDVNRARVVLFGGVAAGAPLNETWEYDGFGWTPMSPSDMPSERFDHAMAEFPGDGYVLIFGGFAFDAANGAFVESDDTWIWDGADWFQLFPSNAPPRRRGHAMAYNASTKTILLFGGTDVAGNVLNDTWRWDGGDWVELNPADPPNVLTEHAMAYDVINERVVLFGGSNGSELLNRTWTWSDDDENWRVELPLNVPDKRMSHALATRDPFCGVLLYGGFDEGGSALEDTWSWDGMNWYPVNVPFPPGPRGDHAMARDSIRERTVLYGGDPGDGSSLTDTWEFEPSRILEVMFHPDVPLPVADAVLASHDGVVLQPGVIIDGTYAVNFWHAAVPDSEVSPLVAEEPVVHAQVAGITEDHNDGSRVAVNANPLQAAGTFCGGAGCAGNGIVWGQWESRWAPGDLGGPLPFPAGVGTHGALVGRTLVRDRPGGLIGPAAPAGCAGSILCGLCTYSNHATHVAGTILGDGTGNAAMVGMSPSATAQIISYDVTLCDPVAQRVCEVIDAASKFGARLGNNSWGTPSGVSGTAQLGLYDVYSAGVDSQAVTRPALASFVSAGNSQRVRGLGAAALPAIYGGTACTIPPPGVVVPGIAEPASAVRNRFFTLSMGRSQSAKNAIVVGAINSGAPATPPGLGRMTTFSSWGPTQDGRIKPDIVAAGAENNTRDGGAGDPDQAITSSNCTPNSGTCGSVNLGYGPLRGTSMSSPAASGAAGLVLEQQNVTGLVTGDVALDSDSLKALLIHTATDLQVHFPAMGGAFMSLLDCSGDAIADDCWPIASPMLGTMQDGPDYVNGWGLMNAQVAAQKVIDGNPDVTIRPSGCPTGVSYAPLPFNSPLGPGGNPSSIGISGCTDAGGNPLTQIWDWVGYVEVPSGTTEIKVTIAWNDPQPAVPPTLGDTGDLLVNDLDLIVTPVTGIAGAFRGPHHYSWFVDPACPYLEAQRVVSTSWDPAVFADHRNNVEQVIIPTAEVDPGWYRIVVQAVGLAVEQPFSIMISTPPNLP